MQNFGKYLIVYVLISCLVAESQPQNEFLELSLTSVSNAGMSNCSRDLKEWPKWIHKVIGILTRKNKARSLKVANTVGIMVQESNIKEIFS